MEVIETALKDVFILKHNEFSDQRGSFVKFFQRSFFESRGIKNGFQEVFYTESKKNVIRGMHFQIPPEDHAKLTTVIDGEILDVVLDLRKSSPTFGKHIKILLSRENRKSIYIPSGCAHGFLSNHDKSIICYMVTTEHSIPHDLGIRWNSFGCDWNIDNPIISERDVSFPTFNEFTSPF